MRLLLDTNRYVDLARGESAVVSTIEQADQTFLPVIVLGELRSGFVRGSKARENEQALSAFLDKPLMAALYLDDATTFHYASLTRQLRRQGTPIPTNDIWIAALALQHGLTLYARDAHFDHLPQIMRI